MKVLVAAPEEDRSSHQVALILPRRAVRPHQRAAQDKDPAVSLRTPRRVLCDETGALRKSAEHDSLEGNASALEVGQYVVKDAQGR